MAKFIAGNLAGMISGKIGNLVFSHGRYGPIIRTRVKPVITTSSYTEATRNIMTTCSRAWAALTEDQKTAWKTWSNSNPITDRLGTSQTLSPHAAYNQINGRHLIYPGTALSVPPVGTNPSALSTATVTYDIGAGEVGITCAPFPFGANCTPWVEAAVVGSAGIRYVKNLRKFAGYNTNNNVNPFIIKDIVEDRFGTLAVGQILHLWIYMYDSATGLLSAPLYKSGAIVTS